MCVCVRDTVRKFYKDVGEIKTKAKLKNGCVLSKSTRKMGLGNMEGHYWSPNFIKESLITFSLILIC